MVQTDCRNWRIEWRGRPVPYITSWTAEALLDTAALTGSRNRLAYVDETPFDRKDGVLWARTPSSRGVGEPDWVGIHPLRQRQCMSRLLCQGCRGPADYDPKLGTLFLVEDARGDELPWKGWPENETTAHPPVCRGCADESLLLCPFLRKTPIVAVRARVSKVVGVSGLLFPGGRDDGAEVKVVAEYGDPVIRWVLARQLMRSLHECTVVDLPNIPSGRAA